MTMTYSHALIINNALFKVIEMTVSLTEDDESEHDFFSELEDYLIKATRESFTNDEYLVTLGSMQEKFQALVNVTGSPMYAEALGYIENCLDELTLLPQPIQEVE